METKFELRTRTGQTVHARLDMRPYRDQIDMEKLVGYLRKKFERIPPYSTLKDVPPSYLEIMGRTPEAVENTGLTDEKKWYRSDSRFFQIPAALHGKSWSELKAGQVVMFSEEVDPAQRGTYSKIGIDINGNFAGDYIPPSLEELMQSEKR